MNKESNTKKLRKFAVLGLASLATALALTGVAILTDRPTVAILALVGIMWLATFRIAASNRREIKALREEREAARTNYELVIEGLCGAVGIRDEVADRETQKLSRLASILVRQMRVPTEQVRVVEQAAALRDVGKQGVARSVLDKRDAFDERDWIEMKRHPEIGYQILREIGFLREVAGVIRAHHERYDGQGYPHRLRGEDIPLAARILSVLDAYVAMTSSRPYRKTRTHEDAMQEVLRNAATQFDPEVVRAFADVERRGLITRTAPEPSRVGDPRVATEV
jgi:HD-GYP domain-containing protein (c-di-GMP phosphodiesterase class II)